MTGDVEMPATARSEDLSKDPHIKAVEKLFRLGDIAAVARVNIDDRDGATGSSHDRPAGLPPFQLILVVVCAEAVAVASRVVELFTWLRFTSDQRNAKQLSELLCERE